MVYMCKFHQKYQLSQANERTKMCTRDKLLDFYKFATGIRESYNDRDRQTETVLSTCFITFY